MLPFQHCIEQLKAELSTTQYDSPGRSRLTADISVLTMAESIMRKRGFMEAGPRHVLKVHAGSSPIHDCISPMFPGHAGKVYTLRLEEVTCKVCLYHLGLHKPQRG